MISPWVQQTSQFTPWVLELSLIQSHLLWEEFSICALCSSCSQSLQFSFHGPPGTHHCWVDRVGMIWEACPTPLHMAGSVTRAPVTHPSTNQAVPCLTSVIWQELVPTQSCAVCFKGSHRHCHKWERSLMSQWLGWASQRHEMLSWPRVMGSNPSHVKLGVHTPSVYM